MISLRNRGKYATPVREEFEHFADRIGVFLGQIFDQDGQVITPEAAFDSAVLDEIRQDLTDLIDALRAQLLDELAELEERVGSMLEIVHNDLSFGTGETVKQFTVPWTGTTPSSAAHWSLTFDCDLAQPHAANGLDVVLSWEYDSASLFTVTRTVKTGGTTPVVAANYSYTAFHHKVSA